MSADDVVVASVAGYSQAARGRVGGDFCRRDGFLGDIPTIMFTASLDPEDEKTCLELGSAGFVHKPADWRQYHKALEEVVLQHT